VISQEHQNDDLGDILIYSVSTPSGQCYHTVTYNGGESRQMGHDIEVILFK
jgi:murein endopeptidase